MDVTLYTEDTKGYGLSEVWDEMRSTVYHPSSDYGASVGYELVGMSAGSAKL